MIRFILHQACTGGSLFSRTVAAMSDVVLLSEVTPAYAPQSLAVKAGLTPQRFVPMSPSTMALAAYPDLEIDDEDRVTNFVNELKALELTCDASGKHLVIRDHSHSEFMLDQHRKKPLMAQVIEQFGGAKAIITCRYPYSSYLSLCEKEWDRHVEDYADYCARYLRFLDAYKSLPIVRLEALCDAPDLVFKTLAGDLELDYAKSLRSDLFAHRVTGESGRKAERMKFELPPVRAWSPALAKAISKVPEHKALCERLDYPVDYTGYALKVTREGMLKGAVDKDTTALLDRLEKATIVLQPKQSKPK